MENSFLDADHNLPVCPSFELQDRPGGPSHHLAATDTIFQRVLNSPQGENFHLLSSWDRNEFRKHRTLNCTENVALVGTIGQYSRNLKADSGTGYPLFQNEDSNIKNSFTTYCEITTPQKRCISSKKAGLMGRNILCNRSLCNPRELLQKLTNFLEIIFYKHSENLLLKERL